jgi:hypothetical protein
VQIGKSLQIISNLKNYMKKSSLSILTFLISLQCIAQTLTGSWEAQKDSKVTTILATDSYLTVTTYDLPNKVFEQTWGGKYTLSSTNEVFVEVEFHSSNPSVVNSSQSYNISLKKKTLEFNEQKYSKVEIGKPNDLNGLWRITARANNEGKMSEMQLGPRKTLKIMIGGYFQWFAINTQSAEFFGTGGGLYTLANGKYSEKILFFSRDNSKVGTELNFEAKVNGKEWIHSGKSSKGDDIKEIWTKQN